MYQLVFISHGQKNVLQKLIQHLSQSMKQRVLIGGRYQYSPGQCLKQNELYTQFRAYDKVTKRDLLLQLHSKTDDFVEKLRDIKHAFVQMVFDVVIMEQQNQVALFFQPGIQVYLSDAIRNTHYIMQNDALVILKFIALGVQQLHEKLTPCGRICAENIAFCTHSFVKLVNNCYSNQLPLQCKAPELLREERATYNSDIFSMGVILYQMVHGCYPFEGDSEQDLLSRIKSKKFKQRETSSPFKIHVSRQVSVLIGQMLEYRPENRPSIQEILAHSMLSFQIDIDPVTYTKPKGSILPQPFLKKYLYLRASRVINKYDEYYEESSYLGISINTKEFVTLYVPDVKMFQAEPRKVQSYFEKLRAIKDSYMPESCGFLCKIEDYQRFRRQPVIASEYCNQGNIFDYLQRKKQYGWLSEKEIYIFMYLIALGYKQIRDIGVTSIHTVNSQRIMIKDGNIKIRQPGLLTPMIQYRLRQSTKIDYFAPQLKERGDFVELDRSDMWSFGVLFYYLLHRQLPQLDPETSTINIQILDTNQKNKNLIGKCLDQNVNKRITLDQVRIEGVNQDLLQQMLEEKRKQEEADEESESEDEQIQQSHKVINQKPKNKHVIFKSRKKVWCKNYNKIICRSSTSSCRLITKILLGLLILWLLFFGIFFVNGGVGLLRTNYYREITLQVPYNYATSLYNLTILSTNGLTIEEEYSDFSYEQFTLDLKCTENNHTKTSQSIGMVYDYINYSHSVQCFFGFIFAFIISFIYGLMTYRLDLPTILTDKKEKKQDNKNLYHHISMQFIMSSMLFCFFYLFALEYIIQMQPCLGIEEHGYPLFTSVESLLNGNPGKFMTNVFLTIVIWSILMFAYSILGILIKKIFIRIFEWKMIIPVAAVMGLFTIICRIGFGGPNPIQPTWSYKLNRDILGKYWGLFGFFPQIVMIIIYAMERLVDAIFWFFLRLGMEPDQEEDIQKVQYQAKLQPNEDYQKIEKNQTNIGAIENQFELFD